MRETIEKIAVLGNGLMGTGISAVFAMAGKSVIMIGRDAGRAGAALEVVGKQIDEFAARGLITSAHAQESHRRVSSSADPGHAASCDFVMEAVTEDLAIKTELFAKLDEACPEDVVLASSSGQPASALTSKVKRPERVLAAHFWFPATLIPVVEVCPSPVTAKAATERTMALLREAGKEPVLMQRETPGMIGNRIQFAILREAWAMWAEGIASAEAIDTVVRQTLGRRLGITGPIESAELGGLDTLHAFAVSLLPHLDASPKPAPAVTKLVEGGARGFANKQGIYDWSSRDGDALKAARVDELFRWLREDAAKSG
ncbi:MAG: 3-hydroxyacyl-CoA dehydrogenase family protein [Salinarimonas sp.]